MKSFIAILVACCSLLVSASPMLGAGSSHKMSFDRYRSIKAAVNTAKFAQVPRPLAHDYFSARFGQDARMAELATKVYLDTPKQSVKATKNAKKNALDAKLVPIWNVNDIGEAKAYIKGRFPKEDQDAALKRFIEIKKKEESPLS
jgi:Na+-transporting NADH:ubiquinone oxidoreductase subunit NqrC